MKFKKNLLLIFLLFSLIFTAPYTWARNTKEISSFFKKPIVIENVAKSNKELLFKIQRLAGISPRQAVKNLHQWGAQPFQKLRPLLQTERAFSITDFSSLVQEAIAHLPAIPFMEGPYMYRGLKLPADGAAIRNILENGLLVKDVGPHNNDRRLFYASMIGPEAIKEILKEPVINLTNSPVNAFFYAARYRQQEGLIVLVKVKGLEEKGKVVSVPYNIPVKNIHSLIALLNLNGTPTWCKVELLADEFKITPYVMPEVK